VRGAAFHLTRRTFHIVESAANRTAYFIPAEEISFRIVENEIQVTDFIQD
jgi:hypothetical protein